MSKRCDVKAIRLPVVMALQETLSDYVRRIINEKNLNYREVARRSGGSISHATVGYIVNNESADVRKETLRALAKGLGVSEDEIFAAARGGVATPRIPIIQAQVSAEIATDLELLASMFLDIPRECQLDTLASLAGVHQRRSLSAKIYERHEARAETRKELDEHKLTVRTGAKPTPRTIPPLSPSEVIQLAREGNIFPHEILGFARTLNPDQLSKFVQEWSPDELSQFGLDQLLNLSEAENPPRLKTG